MKSVELSDETYTALATLAVARHVSIDALLASLAAEKRDSAGGDALRAFLASPEFGTLLDSTDRYIALLAWCATTHRSDFADFVSHQQSGLRYLWLDRDHIVEIRAHNQARQIDGTPFWAVMAIDAKTKRRFVRRLLEFVGCSDEGVREADRALGLGADDSQWPRLLGVA